MRAPLLAATLGLAALGQSALAPTADAQRRWDRDRHGGAGGTDLQALATGLDVDGVGFRFWTSSGSALTLRANLGYTDADADDASTFNLSGAFGFENHLYRRARVHPFFLGAIKGGVLTTSPEDGEDATDFEVGAEVGVGGEWRFSDAMGLSAQYLADLTYRGGDSPDRFDLQIGGLPRMALSFRF